MNYSETYKELFQGRLFIIKASGRIITDQDARENLIETIKDLTEDGINVLFIYGGGEAIDVAMGEADLTPLKVDGRRISSEEDIKIIKRTLVGDLGFKLSETMVKKDMSSTILNAIPPHWTKAKRRPPHNNIERFDGTLIDIQDKEIRKHFGPTNLAICPCIAFTNEGTALNINADNVAIEIAIETKAEKLILMTNIDGVMVNNELQSVLSAKEIEQLIKDGIVTGGMQVKLENAIHALRSGVQRVHILNGLRKNSLREEIYTSKGIGTMIVRHNEKENYLQTEMKGS